MISSRSHCGGGLGAEINFTDVESAIAKTQKMFSSCGDFLTYAMYHHRETIEFNQNTVMKHRSVLFISLGKNGTIR